MEGAPDPTAGSSASEQSSWCLDENKLRANFRTILINFCVPSQDQFQYGLLYLSIAICCLHFASVNVFIIQLSRYLADSSQPIPLVKEFSDALRPAEQEAKRHFEFLSHHARDV